MRIPNRRRGLKNTTSKDLVEVYEKLRFAADLDLKNWLDVVCLTFPEYENMRRGIKELPAHTLSNVADRFHLNIESLVSGKIDYRAVAEQCSGNKSYIPEKYLIGAFSKRRTVVNLLDFIEKKYGWNKRIEVMRRFQIKEKSFVDLDAPINIKLSVDISSWIFGNFGDEGSLVEIGKNAVNTHRNTLMGLELSSSRNLRELFSMMFDSVAERFVEKNFKWTIISMDSFGITVRGVPDCALVEILGKKYMYSRNCCLIRKGFIASIPEYLGYGCANIVEHECVAKGADYCQFYVAFEGLFQRRLNQASVGSNFC